jgi:photosystem II stability/assembly factor-like uncharacterized protein
MKKLLFILLFSGLLIQVNAQNYWKPLASGTNKRLLSISFGSPMVGYIGGQDSLLLKTTDGGNTWQVLPVPMTSGFVNDIIDVRFVDAMTGYIAVNNLENMALTGQVLKTSDGGASWNIFYAGNTVPARLFFFTEGEGYVVGSAFFAGRVISKIAGGLPTFYHHFIFDPSSFIYGVDFRDTATGIAGGDGGMVYRTFDAGQTWDSVQTNSGSTIYALKFLNDSTILAAADNTGATLIISRDTGRTWNIDNSSLSFHYPVMEALTFSRKDSFIAVGRSSIPGKGTIYWHDHNFNMTESTAQPMHDVAMSNDSVAYAVGDSGLILTNRVSEGVGIDPGGLLRGTLNIYPNPSGDRFFTDLPYPHQVRVYDISGRKLFQSASPALRQVIDLRDRDRGIYMVEVTAGRQKAYGKLVLR